MNATETADKIVTEWLDEVGTHDMYWDDLADLKARIAKALDPGICTWKPEYPDGQPYNTSCGNAWFFTEGTAQENGAKFCVYCGKSIEVTKPDPEGIDD
jgi:hypothetical protein